MLVSPVCNPPSGKRPSSVHEVVWQCSRAVVILNVVDVAKPVGAAGVIFHERQGLANIKSSRSILQENFSKTKAREFLMISVSIIEPEVRVGKYKGS